MNFRRLILFPLLALILTEAANGPAAAERVIGEKTHWITAADYPAAALARGEGGRIVVQYIVHGDGRVQDCRAIESSVSAELASATCALINRRARYAPAPALEARGIEVADRIAVEWDARARSADVKPVLHGGATFHPSSGGVSDNDYNQLVARVGDVDVTAFFTIGPDGRLADCGVSGSSGDVELDRYTCALLVRRIRFRMPEEPDGRVYARLSTLTVAWRKPGGTPPRGSRRIPRG